jgi:penicillin-insensitive murein endopeptidase
MSANLVVNGQDQGTVELSGEPSGDQTVLVPQQPELRDKYKAKVTCTSEDGTCSEYFVDFFARDGHTIYVDQYVKETTKKKATTTTTSTSTTSTSSTSSTTVKLPPVPQGQPPAPKVQKPTVSKPQAPAPLKPKVPVLKPVDSSYDNQEEIDDDIPGEKDGGFVGTSDKDILDLFEKPKVETPKVTTTTVPPQKSPDKAIPVKPPVVTPAPKQEPQPKVQPKPVTPPSSKVQPSPKPAEPKPDKEINRPQGSDQAINLPNKGSLRNATNLLALVQQDGFPLKIMWPAKERHFATANMAGVLKAMAEFMQTKIKDYKLVLGDVSGPHGGALYNKYGKLSHKGHENGTDADISYVVKTPEKELNSLVNRGRLSRDLMLPEQWALMKFAFQTGQALVIFVDPAIKHALCYEAQQEGDLKSSADRGVGYEVLRRIYTLSGHDTHFHLRIKCGDNNPRCRNQLLTFGDSGCFPAKK